MRGLAMLALVAVVALVATVALPDGARAQTAEVEREEASPEEPPPEGGGGGAVEVESEEETLPLAAQPESRRRAARPTEDAGVAADPAPADGVAEPDADDVAAADTDPEELQAAAELGVEPVEVEEEEEEEEPAVATAPLRRASQRVCRTDLRGRPIGPLQTQAGTANGNLGVPHRACPRSELAVGGDALIVAQTSELYGHIRANGRGRVSAPLTDPRVEGFVDWELFRYQTVISSVTASYVGLGYFSWGASGQLVLEDDFVLALTGRIVLPTTSGLDQNNFPLAMDLGLTSAFQVADGVRFHAWVNVLGSVGVGGPAHPRGGVRVGGGVDLRAAEWISFVLELASGFGYETALDFLSGQGGVRLGFSDEVGLELAVSFPFLGGVRPFDEGALPLAGSLMLAWNMP